MNPNSAEAVELVTDTDGTWYFQRGWNGLVLAIQANLGGAVSVFTLNDPVLGVIGTGASAIGPLSGPAGAGWVDLGADVRGLDVNAGAPHDDDAVGIYEARELRLVLHNVGGKYNAGEAAFGLESTVRVLARSADILDELEADTSLDPNDYLYRVFTGRVDSWYDAGFVDDDPVAVLTCVDDQAILQGFDVLAGTLTPTAEGVHARTDKVLAAATWATIDGQVPGGVQSTVAWLGSGYNPTLVAEDVEGPAWALLVDYNLAALRSVFVNGEGRVTSAPVDPTSYADWSQVLWQADDPGVSVPVDDGVWEYSRDQLANTVAAHRVGGARITRTNTTSVNRYGGLRGPDTELPLSTDADVETWAGFMVNAKADPVPRLETVRLVSFGFPEYAGVDAEVTVTQYVAGVVGTSAQVPLWDVLLDAMAFPHGYGRRHVMRTPEPGGGVREDTVAIRGFGLSMDDTYAEIEFHTWSIRPFLQVLTLNHNTLGLLSRGNRIA